MARLERLRVYPVKGLDGIDLEEVSVLEGGTLEYDREFALFDSDGDVLNGKRTDRVHDLRTSFDPASDELAIETPENRSRRFDLANEREACARWLSDFFGVELELRRDRSTGYVDRREMGPSVVSTATLETIASWFDELTVDGVRRRLRTNVEVSGVPAFWEDRFVGEHAPTFEVGGVTFEGVTPCGRCVVPQRDPDTGEPLPEFRRRFVRKREATFPEWADSAAFDHFYTVTIIARIPAADRGRRLRIGDPLSVND
ncbi:MOSC domain-containing protein [Natronoglomus mannanivorans]|uniref:MOSC N-terminal beta barrel domain-containing protein n=1 Tax=Natronoglomus mannanivorans TaxID=2979990 RepID=A0AAP2Z2P5_9EURY|nr:MOSC N-terminal beta barrel domain-containing protein [Halobacteria archaeon AArc-xg1-1]